MCQWLLNNSPLPGTSCQITATGSGTYQVIAQNANGCSATDEINLTLGSAITAQFSAPSVAQVGQPITFTDQSVPPPTQRLWNFGDGSPPVSGLSNPTHTYGRAGRFPVVLAVGNGLCSDTAVQEVEVRWDCTTLGLQARFSATPNPVDLNAGGGTVYFNNISVGATAYLWRFGTGDTSTAVSPSYAYTQPGTYSVTLVATNFNCRDSTTQTITVLRAEPQTPSALGSAQEGIISCYPNPVRDELNLLLPDGSWTIQLYEMTGRLVKQWNLQGGGEHKLSLLELPAGYYTLMVEANPVQRYRVRLLKV
ncbi:MAG: PKD domain-containing protein [Bacteroidia bacterium]|nr:PKD domain-containing protein [Bacteroidia bacterium]